MSGGGRPCPHIAGLPSLRQVLTSKFEKSLEARDGRVCNECSGGSGECGDGLWLCLNQDCQMLLCGGEVNHALLHYQENSNHGLQLSLDEQKVRCFGCSSELSLVSPSGDDGPPPNGLTGLQNIGNTCYMNAALQALSNCPPLLDYFLNRSPPKGAESPPSLTKSFQRLLTDMWSPRRHPYIAPTAILYGIRNSHPMFRGFHQHDTQEFLRCLMDQLHEEMKVPELEPSLAQRYLYDWSRLPPSTGESFEQVSEGGAASSQSEGEEYETCDSGVSERSSLSDEQGGSCRDERKSASKSSSSSSSSYRSIISDVFDGRLISSVQCLTCNRVSTRVETFQDLSLPIPNRDHLNILHAGTIATQEEQGWWAWLWDWVCSFFWGPTVGLHDCLSAFFSADELKGDNMYSCEKCNKLRNGVKYSRVLQCPEVLCIHLKRFRHEMMFSSKIGNYVSFPLEGLDLGPYLHSNCPSKVTVYDLSSVICHHGAAGGGGHYTTYALNSSNLLWYEFDDQTVRPVSPETVRNCEAYVLFYRKDVSSVNRLRRRAGRLQELSIEEKRHYFISRDWLNRFNTFAEPGPIDNRTLLCPHGCLCPEAIYEIVSGTVWDFLLDKFGGGPVALKEEVGPCEQCSDQNGEFSLLKVQLLEFLRLEGTTTNVSYAITSSWLSEWDSYVNGHSSNPPGPINNAPLSILNSNVEYCELTAGQWELLHKLYKGGPEIALLSEGEDEDVKEEHEESATDEPPELEGKDSGCWVQNSPVAEKKDLAETEEDPVSTGNREGGIDRLPHAVCSL